MPAALEGPPSPMLLGLSGGGDSVALLHRMVERSGRLFSVTIDHGLRRESASEAQAAMVAASALGVEARVVQLFGLKGVKQAGLRAARYHALFMAAREYGAASVAVAHTQDDQAETVLMRLARWYAGDLGRALECAMEGRFSHPPHAWRALDLAERRGWAWRGLSGMAERAPAPFWPPPAGDLPLIRPLLGERRDELRAFLRARGATWIEDPSNENPAFERVRARRLLVAAGETAHLHLIGLAGAARLRRDEQARAASAWIAAHVRFEAGGAIVDWRGDPEIRLRALSALVTAIGGSAQEPGEAAMKRLAAAIQAGFRSGTLAGALLSAEGRLLRLTREAAGQGGRSGAAPSILPLAAGASGCWDRRLYVSARVSLRLEPNPNDADDPIVMLDARSPSTLSSALDAGALDARWMAEERVRRLLFTSG